MNTSISSTISCPKRAQCVQPNTVVYVPGAPKSDAYIYQVEVGVHLQTDVEFQQVNLSVQLQTDANIRQVNFSVLLQVDADVHLMYVGVQFEACTDFGIFQSV